MNITTPTAPLPDLTTAIRAYLLGMDAGQAHAVVGQVRLTEAEAEAFVAHLPTETHSTETLVAYFLNGYTQGYDEAVDA